MELRAQGSPVSVALIEPGPVDTPFWENIASVDGLLPPDLPLACAPEEVALAIERGLAKPRANITVGATWALLRLAHRLARPLAERVLASAMRLAERSAARGQGRRSIWQPSGAGKLTHGLRSRRSLRVRATGLLRREHAG